MAGWGPRRRKFRANLVRGVFWESLKVGGESGMCGSAPRWLQPDQTGFGFVAIEQQTFSVRGNIQSLLLYFCLFISLHLIPNGFWEFSRKMIFQAKKHKFKFPAVHTRGGAGQRDIHSGVAESVARRRRPWRWSEEEGGGRSASCPCNQGVPAARGRWPCQGGDAEEGQRCSRRATTWRRCSYGAFENFFNKKLRPSDHRRD